MICGRALGSDHITGDLGWLESINEDHCTRFHTWRSGTLNKMQPKFRVILTEGDHYTTIQCKILRLSRCSSYFTNEYELSAHFQQGIRPLTWMSLKWYMISPNFWIVFRLVGHTWCKTSAQVVIIWCLPLMVATFFSLLSVYNCLIKDYINFRVITAELGQSHRYKMLSANLHWLSLLRM